jgi:hypothetical protein
VKPYTLKPWYYDLFITPYNKMLIGLSSVTATAFQPGGKIVHHALLLAVHTMTLKGTVNGGRSVLRSC